MSAIRIYIDLGLEKKMLDAIDLADRNTYFRDLLGKIQVVAEQNGWRIVKTQRGVRGPKQQRPSPAKD